MSQPRWITPAGQLGIVPELDYYEFLLDAYDAAGGTLIYSLVSGRLPLGLQIVLTGKIQGIPVSEAGGDLNVDYRFTVRVRNSVTNSVSDRTFAITITNIAPPIITPKSVNKLITFAGVPITAFAGDYITQASTSANARILESVTTSAVASIAYVSGRIFELGAGNIRINGSSVAAYPISSQERSLFLGLYLTGSEVDLQLAAVEFTPGALLTWELEQGELPQGLTLSSDGLISGFILPIDNPDVDDGWDQSAWNLFGWDFTEQSISKTFVFSIKVTDGVNYDLAIYTLTVYPRSSLTADNSELTIDTSILESGVGLTIDYGRKHSPIITTVQDDLIPVRQGTWFSFNVDAIDLDRDIVHYAVPILATGAYDEQVLLGNSLPYITTTILSDFDRFDVGIFPRALAFSLDSGGIISQIRDSDNSLTTLSPHNFIPGQTIYFSGISAGNLFVGRNYYVATILSTQTFTVAEAPLSTIPISLISTSQPGLDLRVGSPTESTQASTLDFTTVNYRPGEIVKVLDSTRQWREAEITDSTTITITGNTVPVISEGEFIFQSVNGANATVTEVSQTTGTINILGNISTGFIDIILPTFELTLSSNLTATAGQFLTQTTSGANARVITSVTNSTTVSVLYNNGNFLNGSANPVRLNGVAQSAFITGNIKDINSITIVTNVGDYITQIGASGNALVTANVSDAVRLPISINSGTFVVDAGNIRINGVDANVRINALNLITSLATLSAQVDDFITQPASGANARVISDVYNSRSVSIEFVSNNFTIGSGNIQVNGTDTTLFPSSIVTNTNITATYEDSNIWEVGTSGDLNRLTVRKHTGNTANAVSLNSTISSIISVSVDLQDPAEEGTVGFDAGKFDQGALNLPLGLTIDTETGWITGQLPPQTINQVNYEFEIIAFKRDDATYSDSRLYTITVLGDLNNRIDWVTPSNLGVIETGKVSDLFVIAMHASPLQPKTLSYRLKINGAHRLPQGLILLSTGLISGRVSFEVFGLDSGVVSIDNGTTTFDNSYTFTVTAYDADTTVSADRTFNIKVVSQNTRPYENLYLTALPSLEQRRQFDDIIRDQSVFPRELLYRLEDPYFGLAKEVRSLFLAGLTPSELSAYMQATATNHFIKRFLFNDIRIAQVLDTNFNVKYEVVYLQLDSLNDIESATFAHVDEIGPQDTIDLSNIINNPYYAPNGVAYTIAYPNSTQNMESKLISGIGYQDKGALPEWMVSRQPDGRQLGFIHAVVLAYVKPNSGALIAYRLKDKNFNLNKINFTVDRYLLDNQLSKYYDYSANAFITSEEATFDRYPGLSSTFVNVGTVDYAVNDSYESINNRLKSSIVDGLEGLDGIKNFRNGQTLVFAQQEFRRSQDIFGEYNQGWSDVETLWDEENWDWDSDTSVITDDLGWDAASYVPGSIENSINPSVLNKRAGIWQINIDAEEIVTLTFVQSISFFQSVFVRFGFTFGSTNIFFDPLVKPTLSIPNYSIITQEVRTNYTTFDGNGTRYYDNRDEYAVPGEGDKYIKFKQKDVLNTVTIPVTSTVIGSFDSETVTFDSEALTFDQE